MIAGDSEHLLRRKIARREKLAWVIWTVAMIAQMLNTFHRVAAGPAVDRIMADLGITAATWGALMSMYFYIYAILQFPSGLMADSIGPRKTITIGCVISTIGSALFGLANTTFLLFVGRFLLSFGVALTYVNVLRLVVDWFKKKHFSRMIGINSILVTVGSLVGTTPMALLISSVGWRWSFEILAMVNLVICLLCWFIIRDKPADVGLPAPDPPEDIAGDVTTSTPCSDGEDGSLMYRLKQVLKNRFIWSSFLVGMGLYGANLVLMAAWGIPYLMQIYGLSRAESSNFISLMLIAHIVGITILTFIVDRFKVHGSMIMLCGILNFFALVMLVFWNKGMPPVPALYVIFILCGFSLSGTPLAYVVLRQHIQTSMAGLAMGILNMSPFISAAIFQMLVGFVLDASWQGIIRDGVRYYPLSGFQSGFILILIPALAAVVGSVMLNIKQIRNKKS